MARILKCLFFIALIFFGNARMSAQVFVLGDSCQGHWVNVQKVEGTVPKYHIREYLGQNLLFDGYCLKMPAMNEVLDMIAYYFSYRNQFVDTNRFYDLSHQLYAKHIVKDSIVETNTYNQELLQSREITVSGLLLYKYYLNSQGEIEIDYDNPGFNSIHNGHNLNLGILKIKIKDKDGNLREYVQDKRWELNEMGYLYCALDGIYYEFEIGDRGELNVVSTMQWIGKGKWLLTKTPDFFEGSEFGVWTEEIIRYKTHSANWRLRFLKRNRNADYIRDAPSLKIHVIEHRLYGKDSTLKLVIKYNTRNKIRYFEESHKQLVNSIPEYLCVHTKWQKGEFTQHYQTNYKHGVWKWTKRNFNARDTAIVEDNLFVCIYQGVGENVECRIYKNGDFYRYLQLTTDWNYYLKESLKSERYFSNLDEYNFPFYYVLPEMQEIYGEYDSLLVGKDSWLVQKWKYVNKESVKQKILYTKTGKYEIKEKPVQSHINLNLVKDQGNCTYGLKSVFGEWVVQPNYTEILKCPISQQGIYHYIGIAGNTFTIFNDSGRQIGPRYAGVGVQTGVLYPEFQILLKTQATFFLTFQRGDSFVFMLPDGQIILTRNGRLIRNTLPDARFTRFELNGKYGFINVATVYIPPVFDDMQLYYNSKIIYCSQNRLIGGKSESNVFLYDLNGNRITEDTIMFTIGEYAGNIWFRSRNAMLILNDNGKLCRIETETDQQQGYIRDRGFVLVLRKGLQGLFLPNGIEILPVKFNKVDVYNEFLLGWSADSIMIFKNNGELIATYKKFNFKYKNESKVGNYDYNTNFGFIVENQGKHGFLGLDGRLLLAPEYDEIMYLSGTLGFYMEYQFIGIENGLLSRIKDSIYFWQFTPKNTLRSVSSPEMVCIGVDYYKNALATYLPAERKLMYNLKLSVKPNPGIRTAYFTVYDAFDARTNAYLGSMDATGKWVVKLQGYDKWTRISNLFAVKKQNGKCGFVNCNGTELLPALYDKVGYDENKGFYWYCNYEENTEVSKEYWRFKGQQLSWQSDTFDYPVLFKFNYAAVAKNSSMGIINQHGVFVVAPRYDCIRSNNGIIWLLIKNDSFEIWNSNTGEITKLDFNEFYLGRSYVGLAHNNKDVHLINADFKVLSTSRDFFMSNPNILQYQLGFDNRKNNPLNVYISPYRNMLKFKYLTKPEYYRIANLTFILDVLQHPNTLIDLDRTAVLKTFPEHGNYSNCKYYDINDIHRKSIDTLHNWEDSAFMPVDFEQMFDLRTYSIEYYYNHIYSLYNIYGFPTYVNLYFDSTLGLLNMDLRKILVKSEIPMFWQAVTQKWQSLDDPGLPCIKQADLPEFCRKNWYINNGILQISMGTKVVASFTLEQLMPYLKPFWRERLNPATGQ